MKRWKRDAIDVGRGAADLVDEIETDRDGVGMSTERWLQMIADVATEWAREKGKPGCEIDVGDVVGALATKEDGGG